MSSGTEGVGQTTAGLGPAATGLTKRQREVLERLELGMPVKKIATDTGVTPAAVYQTIERLRRQGAVPETLHAVGHAAAPPRRRLGDRSAAPAPPPSRRAKAGWPSCRDLPGRVPTTQPTRKRSRPRSPPATSPRSPTSSAAPTPRAATTSPPSSPRPACAGSAPSAPPIRRAPIPSRTRGAANPPEESHHMVIVLIVLGVVLLLGLIFVLDPQLDDRVAQPRRRGMVRDRRPAQAPPRPGAEPGRDGQGLRARTSSRRSRTSPRRAPPRCRRPGPAAGEPGRGRARPRARRPARRRRAVPRPAGDRELPAALAQPVASSRTRSRPRAGSTTRTSRPTTRRSRSSRTRSIAGMGGFTAREFFEIEDAAQREPVDVSFSNPPGGAPRGPAAAAGARRQPLLRPRRRRRPRRSSPAGVVRRRSAAARAGRSPHAAGLDRPAQTAVGVSDARSAGVVTPLESTTWNARPGTSLRSADVVVVPARVGGAR